jgi:hypothetical protein
VAVRLHPHAKVRLPERGASVDEVIATVQAGEQFVAKYGRTGFRRNFAFDDVWRGKHYRIKQIEAFCVLEDGDWLVIIFVARYF